MEKINVLYCPVGRQCEMVEIENNMGAIQRLVGCDELEIAKPWSQDVAVVFYEHAKRKNRRLHAEQGEGSVVVSGGFVVALMPRGCSEFLPMPRMVVDRYSKLMEVVE